MKEKNSALRVRDLEAGAHEMIDRLKMAQKYVCGPWTLPGTAAVSE